MKEKALYFSDIKAAFKQMVLKWQKWLILIWLLGWANKHIMKSSLLSQVPSLWPVSRNLTQFPDFMSCFKSSYKAYKENAPNKTEIILPKIREQALLHLCDLSFRVAGDSWLLKN